MNLTRLIRCGVVCAAFALTVRPGCAGSGELAASFGGASITKNGGSHPIVGTSFGFNVHPRVMVFGETAYVVRPNSLGMTNVGGGMRINLSSRESRIVPYALGVVGLSHMNLIRSCSTLICTLEPHNQYYAGGGGGANIYIGHSWGVKPEFRFQHVNTPLGMNLFTYTGGVFFQFGD